MRQSAAPVYVVRDDWRLRAATPADAARLHALTSQEPVYRFLFDGVAPSRERIATWIKEAAARRAATGLGLWLLERPAVVCAGAIDLRVKAPSPSAEMTYLLDPAYWRQGLATRMAWTTIVHAFRTGGITSVSAGTDLPNTASQAVMRRLGMRHVRDVAYPLGAGVEYVLHRGEAGPDPPPALLPLG